MTKKTLLYDPMSCIGPHCLKTSEPLQGDSLLFNLKFPISFRTHLEAVERLKTDWTMQPPSCSEIRTSVLTIKCPN